MEFYFLLGGFFGIIIGFVMSSLLTMSSKNLEEENMLAYIDQLEEEKDKLREHVKKLSK